MSLINVCSARIKLQTNYKLKAGSFLYFLEALEFAIVKRLNNLKMKSNIDFLAQIN